MKRILIGLTFGLVLAAQPYGRPGYDSGRASHSHSSYSFAERIARGERLGLLTRHEAAHLWAMERELRIESERFYRSGYGLSRRERARLEGMRARLDREITRQMRDGDREYRSGYGRW
jgi:hypothetical protein